MYREQTFVEHCFCREPATRPCRCCGRARCEAHVEKGLCNRCTQFVGRELEKRVSHAWIAGGAVGFILTLALLINGVIASVIIGTPVAVVVGLAYLRIHRARLIRAMGPALSASKGELPPAPREPDRDDFYLGSRNNTPPGGYR